MTRRKNPYANDPRTRAAKAQGYPARSIFKLQEIDQRVRLLKPGQRVLDLGAAPGSWSLYASQRVGASGRVVAVDLKPIEQAFPSQVAVIQGDALSVKSEAILAAAPFDVVLSDMAPSTSGNKQRDQVMSYELFDGALLVAAEFGRAGGHFVGKLFMGPDFEAARQAVRDRYAQCKVIRPVGTRTVSSEVFLVGMALRRGSESSPPQAEGG